MLGRFDTIEHRVGDCPHLWPGKDYYNPRESEPNSWEDTMKDELNRQKYPRMPWHDVHCALWGPACRDVARHFIQCWNHAKKSKAPNEQTIPLLMPQHHMVLPHYMGKSKEMDIESKNAEEIPQQDSFSPSPFRDTPLLLPQEAEAPVSHSLDQKLLYDYRSCSLPDQQTGFYGRFSFSFQESKVAGSVSVTPEKDCGDELNSLDILSDSQMTDEPSVTSEEDNHDASSCGQIGPRTTCHCQVIRSVSQWSAGTSQTEESIHSAYFSLIENQFFISGVFGDETIQNRVLDALYKRILLAHKEQQCFRVIIVIPLLPGFQGGIDDNGAATVRAIMHWQNRTISREKTSILYNLNALLGPKTENYISFYGLRTYGRLFKDGPAATNQIYVHSKVMIVDDNIAVIGSSNTNDRSLLGSRDSEIGVVIEDKEFVYSTMNGEPWKAGKFTYSLRCSLWSEHLGLNAGEINKINDPVAEATYKDLWLAMAKENTKIYQDVFACLPNEVIYSRAASETKRKLLEGETGAHYH